MEVIQTYHQTRMPRQYVLTFTGMQVPNLQFQTNTCTRKTEIDWIVCLSNTCRNIMYFYLCSSLQNCYIQQAHPFEARYYYPLETTLVMHLLLTFIQLCVIVPLSYYVITLEEWGQGLAKLIWETEMSNRFLLYHLDNDPVLVILLPRVYSFCNRSMSLFGGGKSEREACNPSCDCVTNEVMFLQM